MQKNSDKCFLAMACMMSGLFPFVLCYSRPLDHSALEEGRKAEERLVRYLERTGAANKKFGDNMVINGKLATLVPPFGGMGP